MHKFTQISDMPSMVYVSPKMIDDRVEASYYRKQYLDVDEKIVTFNNGFMYLKNLCTKITDGTHKTPDYKPEGIKFITAKNILEDGIDFEDVKYISKDEHNEISKRCKVEPGDMLFTKVGRIGYAKVVPANVPNFSIFVSVALLKLKGNVDSRFIEAFLNSKYGRIQSERLVKGSNQPDFHLEDIAEIKVPIPSPEIQKYIGDKVRKAEELREEAKTLQKEIDILLEVDMLLKEETDKVYNIYDSKINWTNEINIEDRIDPNFYQKKYISTIEKLGNNKVRLEKYVRITKIRYQTGNINKYIEISSINNSFGTIDEVKELRPEEIPTSAKYQVKEGDILVSLVRPTRKAISIVTKEYDNAICTGGFAVLQSKGKVPVEFLTAVLRTNFVGIQFERYCAGSTYPTINEDDVVKVFIPMYSENQINKITENYRRIIDNIYTSKKLIEEAKQDVEDLIEGNFDMSKVKANS